MNNTTISAKLPPKFIKQTPEYLKDFLTKLTIPSELTLDWLSTVGENALLEKRAYIEAENLMLASRLHKRIPDQLDFFETAVILAFIIPFKNIYVSKESNDTLLGAYQMQGPHKGIYETNIETLYRLVDVVSPKFRDRDIQDTLNKIKRIVPTKTQTTDSNLVIANNGIFNKTTKKLEPFSPDYIYLAKLAIDYKDNPQNPILIADDGYKWDVDTWISELAIDEETNQLIWQVISDFIQSGYSREKAIFFYSQSGNNGKGTLGQLMKNIVGKGNYSSLAIVDFKHEFLKESLLGVTANIADENDVDQYIDSIRDFKASITGDDINVNRKFEKPIRLQFRGTNIQMLNGLPKTRDKSDSFYRRLILVPFLKSFTNNGQRTYIKDVYIKNKEVLEYVLWKAFNMDFETFIIPERSKELLKDYKEINNPVVQFWNELESEFVWDLLPTQFLYDLFISWFSRNNPMGKPMSKQSFMDNLRIIIDSSTLWENHFEKNDKVKTGKKMIKDEPLITDYQLVNWYNQARLGSKPSEKLREFTRKSSYRGITRK